MLQPNNLNGILIVVPKFLISKVLMRAIVFFLCSILFSGPSFSSEQLDKEAVQLSIPAGNLEVQQNLIQTKMAGVEYSEMSADNRKQINTELEAIVSGSITGETAMKAQKNINELLVKAFSDSKLVCSREKKTGSHMLTRTCMTAAAKKRQHDKTQEDLSKGRLPSSAAPNN
jgi:hypothetical protein